MKQADDRSSYFPKLPTSPVPKAAGDGGASLEASVNALPLPFTPHHAPPRPAHSFSYHSLHHNLRLLQSSAHQQRMKNGR